MSPKNDVSLIYAAATLRSAGKPVTRETLGTLLDVTGVQADPAEIDALLSLVAVEGQPGSQPDPQPDPQAGPQERPARQSPPRPKTGNAQNTHHRALYVYAVAVGEPTPFETAGIDDAEVFAVPENGLVAVVHECAAKPYASKDKETVEKWVIRHQAVVMEACRRYAAVLPMAFDTMVSGKDRADAADHLRTWLHDDGDALLQKADRVRHRQEYGVQVFLDVESATPDVMATCPEVVELKKALTGKSEGAVYFQKQELEKRVREQILKRAETVFREAFDLARQNAVEVSVGKLKTGQDNLRMVANLSCLLENGTDEALRAAFSDYCTGKGLSVRVTGPWPPYSFT